MTDDNDSDTPRGAEVIPYPVGYKRPPEHTRFKPGKSGNPSGRAKGSQNLRTLFKKVMAEKVSLREGGDVRKVSKAEAILRGMVVSAMRGDAKSAAAVLRLAEQTGEFAEEKPAITQIQRIIIGWQDGAPRSPTDSLAKREINTE
jgi:Family of unknown function (DUF5681)